LSVEWEDEFLTITPVTSDTHPAIQFPKKSLRPDEQARVNEDEEDEEGRQEEDTLEGSPNPPPSIVSPETPVVAPTKKPVTSSVTIGVAKRVSNGITKRGPKAAVTPR
jgi:hypothetical protein